MFLMGNFQHSLDDKNRIRLPSDFRKDMGMEYFLMPGSNGSIFVYKADEAQRSLSQLLSLESFDPAQNMRLAQLFGFSRKVTADGQGRFMLPDDLIEIMGIKKDVVIVGAGTKAMIWSSERWSQLCGGDKKVTPTSFDELYRGLDAELSKQKWSDK